MKLYRVQKVTPSGEVVEEAEVRARTAEDAASSMVEGNLFRGQKGYRATLRAKVYAPGATGVTTLVRFYERDEGSSK